GRGHDRFRCDRNDRGDGRNQERETEAGSLQIASLTITVSGEAWALRGHLIKDGSTTWVIVIPRGGTGGSFSTSVSAAVNLSGAVLKLTGMSFGGAVTAEAFVTTATNKGT